MAVLGNYYTSTHAGLWLDWSHYPNTKINAKVRPWSHLPGFRCRWRACSRSGSGKTPAPSSQALRQRPRACRQKMWKVEIEKSVDSDLVMCHHTGSRGRVCNAGDDSGCRHGVDGEHADCIERVPTRNVKGSQLADQGLRQSG